ncbi:MAG: hypothetical protein WKG07_10525 [Hymenobacter sp.]
MIKHARGRDQPQHVKTVAKAIGLHRGRLGNTRRYGARIQPADKLTC